MANFTLKTPGKRIRKTPTKEKAPNMKTKTTNLYAFTELSPAAQAVAIANEREYRAQAGDSWAHENKESLNAFCDAFPVRAKSWSYSACSHDITALFTGEKSAGDLSGVRLLAYLQNNYGHLLSAPVIFRKGYGPGKKRLSKAVFTASSCPFTGYCADEDLLQPIREFIQKPDARTFRELLYDCLESWAQAREDDCAYQESESTARENLESNPDEIFLESGEIE